MVLGLFGYANMWAAVFADSGVAMICVLNAVRLLYKGTRLIFCPGKIPGGLCFHALDGRRKMIKSV